MIHRTLYALIGVMAAFATAPAIGATRTVSFDTDPIWDALNNRLSDEAYTAVAQDFGYSATNIAGKAKGEIGGRVWRSVTPASYAAAIAPKTLNDKLSASGTFAITDTS